MSQFPPSSFFDPTPKTTAPLGFHRILSPTASVKVSPLCLGGISIGSSWSPLFGKNEDPYTLLDNFYALGGNFIDTSNVYNSEESERLIGSWMQERGIRDEMVIATKYSVGYKNYDRQRWKLQSNYTGNSAKSMLISVRESLEKLKTDYIDILYVHWWDFGTSVEEVMRGLHTFVLDRKVLYLGVCNTPAWVVVKANMYARQHGLTPFSVYSGKWNVGQRDLEAEIIPMCESEGMGVVPWGALGSGNLLSKEQRKEREGQEGARKMRPLSGKDVKVAEVLEKIAGEKGTTLQAVALAYLFQQTTYVVPIMGVQTVEHVKAMPDALNVKLSATDLQELYEASEFHPQFPVDFLFDFRGDRAYHLGLVGTEHNQQYQMGARVQGPPRPVTYEEGCKGPGAQESSHIHRRDRQEAPIL